MDFNNLTLFDYGIAFVLLLFAARGVWLGFVRQLAGFFAFKIRPGSTSSNEPFRQRFSSAVRRTRDGRRYLQYRRSALLSKCYQLQANE